MTLNQRLLQALLDQHPDPLVFHTPVFEGENQAVVSDFVLAYCNECQRRQADLPVDDMIGQNVSSIFGYSDEGRRLLFQQLLQVYTTGEELDNTYHNEVLDVFFHVQRKKVEGGVLTVARNVTEEVKARVEKDRQKELVNLILTSSLDGWFICEAVKNENGTIQDFIIKRINPGFTEFVGLCEEQVVGKSYLSIFPSAKQQGIFDLNSRVFNSGRRERQQMPYHGDGLDAWYDIVVSKLDEKSILVTFADITAEKKNQQELERKNTLLDNILLHSVNGISVTRMIRDGEGNIVDGQTILANEAATLHTGLPREVYLTKTAVQIEPNITSSPYFQMCLRTIETGEPSFVEYEMESTGKWLQITVSKMDQDHIITIFTDVTTAHKAQQERERLVQELMRSNAALEEFTRASSHDLQEPIRKVYYFVERLRSSVADRLKPEEDAMFERVMHAADRMNLLVNDLLEYSHLRQSEAEKETIDLNQKLQRVQNDLELLIREKNAVLHVGPLPTVKGYRRQLQQLFQNLISNAIKYSRPGVKPEVSITSKEIGAAEAPMPLPSSLSTQHFHHIQVCDNGIGFDDADAERIFNVFTRLHGNKEYPGTGIGLSIAKKVVENHHGFIFAKGRTGHGSCFHVLLPAQ